MNPTDCEMGQVANPSEMTSDRTSVVNAKVDLEVKETAVGMLCASDRV